MVARSTLALLLGIGELLFLTVRYDTAVLSTDGSWLQWLAANSSMLPQLFAVMVASTLIFGSQHVADFLTRIADSEASAFRWRQIAVNAVCFVLFVVCSERIFSNHGRVNGWEFVLWMALGVLWGISWLTCWLSVDKWRDILLSSGRPLVACGLIAVVAWGASRLANMYWQPFAHWTTGMVKMGLNATGVNLRVDDSPYVVGTDRFAVQIMPECSGYEGMGLAFVFVSTYLWWCRSDHRFPNALLLVPLVLITMFFVNALRITALILLGHNGFEEFAAGGFHSQAGWLAYNCVVIGAIAIARRIPFFCSTRTESLASVNEPVQSRAVPMILPFFMLTLAVTIADALFPGSPWTYPFKILSVVTTLWLMRSSYWSGVSWRPDWFSVFTGIAVYLLWISLEAASSAAHTSLGSSAFQDTNAITFAAWMVIRVLGSVVVIPIAEELAFRGYLVPLLSRASRNQKASWLAIIVTSVAFGLLHTGRWIAGTLAGVLYGITYRRRQSVADAILSHSITNALIAFHVIAYARWSLWT